MRYGLLLGLLSFGFLGFAWFFGQSAYTLPVALLFAWATLAFQAVATAYLTAEPRLFGKTPDGRLPTLRALLLGPYLALAWAVRDLLITSRTDEAPWHEVGPGLYLGRYLKRASALPPGTTCVVDLTCEMSKIPGLDPSVEYLVAPALDGSLPAPAELDRLVTLLTPKDGVLYVHCAAGHGRSAVVCAALLVTRGLVADVPAAIERLQSLRPLVSMNPDQRAELARTARVVRAASR